MRNIHLEPTDAEVEARRAELVFVFVAPVGSNVYRVAEVLRLLLQEFGYATTEIRISAQFEPLAELLGCKLDLAHSNEVERVEKYMDAGNRLCSLAARNDFLAVAAVQQIKESRSARPPRGRAYLILSVKRPQEIALLRKIYGVGLFVIGVYSSNEQRVKYLKTEKGATEDKAIQLIDRDRNDGKTGGQRTGDAYHMSDVFLDIGTKEKDWSAEVGRLLDLIFSHPYHTPSQDEYAMFVAFGAGVRSAQFGRQVGASIFDKNFELLSVGCNEVPKAGGGQYWPGDDDDDRDHVRQFDSNDLQKNQILDAVLNALPSDCDRDEADKKIRMTPLLEITEFGRATHAEMEAIISCARKGISVRGASLYTTTFPCHNCARHIVGSGIAKVVYIEPYPKSRATELHDDSIRTNAGGNLKSVPFNSFVGVAPSRYVDLFSTRPLFGAQIERKMKDGRAIPWLRIRTQLRTPLMTLSYLQREDSAVADLENTIDNEAKQRRISFEEGSDGESTDNESE